MEHTEAISTNATRSNQIDRDDDSPLPLLVEKLASAEGEVKASQMRVDALSAAIARRVAPHVAKAREDFKKTEGVIHVAVEGCDVTSDVPKNVKWDQKLLNAAAEEISKLGEDPFQYIDFKAVVSEKKWEVLPKALRDLIAPAREMKHGKEKIAVTVAE